MVGEKTVQKIIDRKHQFLNIHARSEIVEGFISKSCPEIAVTSGRNNHYDLNDDIMLNGKEDFQDFKIHSGSLKVIEDEIDEIFLIARVSLPKYPVKISEKWPEKSIP